MLGTYASFLLILGASAIVGQAVLAACGRRTWSRLSPAVGLAALLAISWATVRLPGHGTAAIVALGVLTAFAALVLRGRLDDLPRALRIGVPVELIALAVASIPFIVEMRFGILGTGLNPDMSQHLFAADRLAHGGAERLISNGYPLGPHSLVVAVSALGANTVHAFDGLQLAVAVSTCLAALGLLERLSPSRRIVGALLVGFAYLLASYFTQGSFKETIEALLLLAFAIGVGELAREWRRRSAGPRAARGLPLAVLAIGAVYAYSFPGLVWLLVALGAWIAVELGRALAGRSLGGFAVTVREAAPAAALAVGLLAVGIAPEAGRMVDFAGFETFAPDGPGLGNLFNRLSPLEALGIWPSGDFRVEPGDGAVPALVFYVGAAVAIAALCFGLIWWWRRGERAVPAALGGAAALWLYSLLDGTPYQEAKALVLAAPLVATVAVRALLEEAPSVAEARMILRRRSPALLLPGRARAAKLRLAIGALAAVFAVAAAGSSVLALANGPVGPTAYSPQLAELRGRLPGGSIYVYAPADVLSDQHGRDYLAWELRGNRICIVPSGPSAAAPRPGVETSVTVVERDGALVVAAIHRAPRPSGSGPCKPIPGGARADPSAGDP